MLQSSKAYLWDAQQAAKSVLLFIADADEESFYQSLLLQSAVERQLEILGESLNRLRRNDPYTAEVIPNLHRIIGMRNIIAHEYGAVDHAIIWAVATRRLEPLISVIESLLQEG